MTIYNAYLIKGYLIDKKAPKQIREALDILIGSLMPPQATPPLGRTPREYEEDHAERLTAGDDLEETDVEEDEPEPLAAEAPPAKQRKPRKPLTPQQLEALRERCRLMREKRGKKDDSGKETEPGEA